MVGMSVTAVMTVVTLVTVVVIIARGMSVSCRVAMAVAWFRGVSVLMSERMMIMMMIVITAWIVALSVIVNLTVKMTMIVAFAILLRAPGLTRMEVGIGARLGKAKVRDGCLCLRNGLEEFLLDQYISRLHDTPHRRSSRISI